MPNIAAAIGPGIQTFLQMRQFMAQEHAQREAERAKGLAALTGIAGAPADPAVAPQASPPAVPFVAQGQPAPAQDDTPPPPMIPVHGRPAPPPMPMAPGNGPPPPSANIASIISALSSMGAAKPMPGQGAAPPPAGPMPGPPPAAPAAPPTGGMPGQGAAPAPGGGQPIPGSKEQFYSIMREVSKRAPPGTPPQRIFEAAMDLIPGIKGMEPETKALLVQSANDARTIAQLQAQLAHYSSNETIAEGHDATREDVASTNAGSRRDVAEIGAGSRVKAAEVGAGSRVRSAEIGAGARRYGADRGLEGRRYGADKSLEGRKYGADHPRPASGSRYDREAEVNKMTRTLISTQGLPAAEAHRQAEAIVGNEGGGGSGGGTAPAPRFQEGHVYVDAHGNQMKYQGGKWVKP